MQGATPLPSHTSFIRLICRDFIVKLSMIASSYLEIA